MKEELSENGFCILKDVLSDFEVDRLLSIVSNLDTSNPAFRKSKDLFAIRRFFQEVPDALEIIGRSKLIPIIESEFGNEFFIVKSIFFDKPPLSNWFVPYHQDLTISVDKKIDQPGFGPWTVKQGQFAVQPPLEILEDNITIRLHLDETTGSNGALKVVPQSHRKGLYRPRAVEQNCETGVVCAVPRGGIMVMRPLLLHASGRTTDGLPRRVIHIEFSRKTLPEPLEWSERVIRSFPRQV